MGGNFTDEVRLPDQELYERWLQVATFLPVIRYTHLPSKYGNDTLLEMAKILTALRYKTVHLNYFYQQVIIQFPRQAIHALISFFDLLFLKQ